MTIWLLAVLLLASLAGLGYRQGAIRVAFSLVGILVGALLAVPLGRPLSRLLAGPLGMSQPVLAWVLGPVIVFIVISLIFKAVAAVVHHKVDVYYKYKAGDLRLILWERLNRRTGLCLALLNGTAYLILISYLIYIFSYWTVQMASSESDPRTLRILNQLGRDLQASGFAKVARSIDSMPPSYYEAADVAGLIYANPLLEARLSRYPAFLSLAERPDFQALGADKEFLKARQEQKPALEVLGQGAAQAIFQSPETLRLVWTTALPDLSDLRTYLETGKSQKYGAEKILGRWEFNVSAAFIAVRRAKPNIKPKEMAEFKRWMQGAFLKTAMVAMPDGKVIIKDLPALRFTAGSAAVGGQSLQGEWKTVAGQYQVSVSGNEVAAIVDKNDRLTLKAEALDLVFDPQG